MIKKLLFLLVLLLTATTGAWATDGIACSASDIGKVLCTDGSIYENVSAVPAGKTAAAVIVYVDETNKKGLAIALADEGTMNWSTAKSTCEGKTAITGVKWCLPSQNQWEQMFQANGGTTAENTVLNTTITTAGGTPLQENGTYWSSSEKSPGVSACTVVLISDIVGWSNKTEDNAYKVRACLAFAPPSYAVTLAEGTEDAKNWTIPAEAAVGTTVTATYSGDKKVKSVKAVKKNTAKTLAEATSEDIGKIAGKDGKIYATKADAEAVATGNAVAMIAYVGTASDCTHGLAIALEDVSNEQLTWNNSGNNNESKTAAEWCSAWNTSKAVTGGTWRLPSINDWQYMFIGCGSSESYSPPTIKMSKSYSGLASKLNTAQGAALQSDFYWSSTVYENNGYWGVVFDGSDATFHFDVESEEHQVRACLAF